MKDDERPGVGERQAANEDAVHGTEHRRRGADAEDDAGERDDGETGIAAHHAGAESDIPPHRACGVSRKVPVNARVLRPRRGPAASPTQCAEPALSSLQMSSFNQAERDSSPDGDAIWFSDPVS